MILSAIETSTPFWKKPPLRDKLEFGGECGLATAIEIPLARIEIGPGVPSKSA